VPRSCTASDSVTIRLDELRPLLTEQEYARLTNGSTTPVSLRISRGIYSTTVNAEVTP
jgi:hypothetical protein